MADTVTGCRCEPAAFFHYICSSCDISGLEDYNILWYDQMF